MGVGDVEEKSVKPYTVQQRKALHLYCEMLAAALNDAGWSVQKTLRHDIDIPWTKQLVKELLWKKIMKAMTDKDSTEDMDSIEPSQIYEVLNLHLGEKLGIHVDWPCEETLYK